MNQRPDEVRPDISRSTDTDACEPTAPLASRYRLSLVIFATVVAADQATKAWALRALEGGRVIDVLDPVMELRLVRNPGAAFSFATNATWVFTVIATVVVCGVLLCLGRVRSHWWAVALGLLAGGAAGNLVDRLMRPPGFARGHVIDFLAWPNFPVFNVADSCVVTAAIMIGIAGLRGMGIDGRRHV